MSGQDRIEIAWRGRTLRGSSDLDVSMVGLSASSGTNWDGSAHRSLRPVPGRVAGAITFDDPVTEADLMSVSGASVRCTLVDGMACGLHGASMLRVGPACSETPSPSNSLGDQQPDCATT